MVAPPLIITGSFPQKTSVNPSSHRAIENLKTAKISEAHFFGRGVFFPTFLQKDGIPFVQMT